MLKLKKKTVQWCELTKVSKFRDMDLRPYKHFAQKADVSKLPLSSSLVFVAQSLSHRGG
jgi:hypothetical protein